MTISISRRRVLLALASSCVAAPAILRSADAGAAVRITAIGKPFLLGPLTARNGTRIACRTDGSFAVTGVDDNNESYLRAFNSHAKPLGSVVPLFRRSVDSLVPVPVDQGSLLVIGSVLKPYESDAVGQIWAQSIDQSLARNGPPELICKDSPSPIESFVNVRACRLKTGDILAVWEDDVIEIFIRAAIVSQSGALKKGFVASSGSYGGMRVYSIAPAGNGAVLVYSRFRQIVPPDQSKEVVVQLIDSAGNLAGKPWVLHGPTVGGGNDEGKEFSLVALPSGGFTALWLATGNHPSENRLYWQSFPSPTGGPGPVHSHWVSGSYFINAPIASAIDINGEILVVMNRIFGPDRRSVISAWLIAPSGALLAGPVDIADTYGVDSVARIGTHRFLVAYPNLSQPTGQIIRTHVA